MGASLLQYAALKKMLGEVEPKPKPIPATPLSEQIYWAVNPIPYPSKEEMVYASKKIGAKLLGGDNDPEGREAERRDLIKTYQENFNQLPSAYQNQLSSRLTTEDAWRFYLGLPQIKNSVTPSKFKPVKASNPNTQYYRTDHVWDYLQAVVGGVEGLVNYIGKRESKPMGGPLQLGNFTLSKGQDERGHYLSYYDIYDFDVPGSKLVGKPFELYDRLYYDPKTFKPIDEKKLPPSKEQEKQIRVSRRVLEKLFGANVQFK